MRTTAQESATATERLPGHTWLERIERIVMAGFAGLWHGCGREEVDPLPSSGPAILVANHPSHADPAFLLATCRRWIEFLQARECYAVPVLRRLFDHVGCIPIARGHADVAGIRTALRRLRAGAVVGLFPEGDVTLSDGVVRPGKTGAALLALRSGAPVYPAWIAGGPHGRSMLGAWLLPSAAVRVIYGGPVDLSAFRNRPITASLLREATGVIMRGIRELPVRKRPTFNMRAMRSPLGGHANR